MLSDLMEGVDMGDKERVFRSAASSVPTVVSADSVGLPGSNKDIDQQLKELKEEVLRDFSDVFVDELILMIELLESLSSSRWLRGM